MRNILLLFVVAVLVITGCHQGKQSSKSSTELEIGTEYLVQIRRDMLGAGAPQPIPPLTGNINGADVCVGGKLSKIDDEWIVLEQGNEKVLWIPRQSVLLIERTTQQQSHSH
jgi:hypothetical protein